MRARSLDEAASLLGITPADIVKTLVVKRSDGTFLFALVPGDRQLSWPKLRALVGVNKLQLPSPEAALAATGYERGTITPLGSTGDWPVYADASMLGRRVSLGAGEHGCSLFVHADELLAALSAVVADISEPANP
ncbi:MAG: YbaK/EbsC family protein [Microcella sp.]|nr:MAG: YbaK/EbsC family protein [Microcella sp.]